MINGAILSVPVAAAVWLLLRLTPRRALNASTRYAVWWAALLLIFCLWAGRTSIGPVEPAPIVVPLKTSPLPWIRMILAAWLALSLLLLIRLIAGYWSLHKRRARATEAPADLCGRAKDWLALRPGARLAISNEISIPVAIGPWRPTILIPARLKERLDPEELDQIVVHEAAHLARRDDAVLLLQRVIEALLPLHPAVRWITRQIDLEREIACDDFVVETLRNPRSYARCLTRVVELSGHVRGSLAAATAVDHFSHLARRIEMLLEPRHTGTRLRKARLGAIVTVLALFGWMGGRIPGLVSFAMAQAAAQPAPAPQPTQAPAAPKPQRAKPAAAPVPAARVLDPSQDPEGKELSGRFGWELGYLHFAKNVDVEEDPDLQAFGEVFKQLLQVYKSFNGTAAEQDAAIKTQLARFRAMLDELTAARLKDEGRQ
jgi:beta-lactamase regulating signal transducer with metallopeptidase domain